MAAYTIIGARPTQGLAADGLSLEDFMQADAVTVEHKVAFTVTVPKAPGWEVAIKEAAAAEAALIESLFTP